MYDNSRTFAFSLRTIRLHNVYLPSCSSQLFFWSVHRSAWCFSCTGEHKYLEQNGSCSALHNRKASQWESPDCQWMGPECHLQHKHTEERCLHSICNSRLIMCSWNRNTKWGYIPTADTLALWLSGTTFAGKLNDIVLLRVFCFSWNSRNKVWEYDCSSPSG